MTSALPRKICVLDIGSHKAEEVMLFAGTPHWTRRNRLRMAALHRHRAVPEMARIARFSQDFAAAIACHYVLVEPVMHSELLRFAARHPTLLLGGVTSCDDAGETQLLMANDSLGNSIIPTKPGLSGERRATFNYHFPALYDFVHSQFVASGVCEGILLRMNAEGVEGPIMDFLADHPHKPLALAGSLGDIRKCFGQEEYDRTQAVMAQAGIPFVYLTSHPRYWAEGLERLLALLDPPGDACAAA